jgi:hypothetical protein
MTLYIETNTGKDIKIKTKIEIETERSWRGAETER